MTRDFQRELVKMKRAFADEALINLGRIEQEWRRALNREAGSLRAAHALAHKLAGAGGTFGFSNISQVANELQVRLAELQDDADLPPAEVRAAIEAELAQLKKACQAAQEAAKGR